MYSQVQLPPTFQDSHQPAHTNIPGDNQQTNNSNNIQNIHALPPHNVAIPINISACKSWLHNDFPFISCWLTQTPTKMFSLLMPSSEQPLNTSPAILSPRSDRNGKSCHFFVTHGTDERWQWRLAVAT